MPKGVAGEVERRRPVGGGGAVENVMFLRPGLMGCLREVLRR